MGGRQWIGIACALLGVLATGTPAIAHSEVSVRMKSELVYAPNGSVTGIHHIWTFDEKFSAFAVKGLDANGSRAITRADLEPVTQVNMESLKEYNYFTFAKADGKAIAFKPPVDYWSEYDAVSAVLTLNFLLPLNAPLKPRNLVVEIYDPASLVEFRFEAQDPVVLAGAPKNCALTVHRATEGQAGSILLGKPAPNQKNRAGNGAMNPAIAVNCR